MLNASPSFDACYRDDGSFDPACAGGYSEPVRFTVPTPPTRYAGSARRYSFIRQIELRLQARPLGADRPYRVCYTAVRRRCLKGVLNGHDWNSAATDTLTATSRGMAAFTTFRSCVGTRQVAIARIRTN
jgi:hypothetical protein